MYRLLIIEVDRGIAEAIREQAELWDLTVECIQNFRNVMTEFAAFNPHIVLMAKLLATLRRTYDFAPSVPVLEHRGAFLNTGDNTLRYRDEKISLSKNEFRILLILMENKGRIVSREKLMEALGKQTAS